MPTYQPTPRYASRARLKSQSSGTRPVLLLFLSTSTQTKEDGSNDDFLFRQPNQESFVFQWRFMKNFLQRRVLFF